MEFEYTAVIRTLGTAGEKYQQLLDSLQAQSVAPKAIIVYIAEGYPLPKETIGTERYVYVKKGMVAQRALPYDEVETEWMLFLDDDVYLPSQAVETLFNQLREYGGDVISPCVFANHRVSLKSRIRGTLLGREVCRVFGNHWGYKVLPTAGFSYNNRPKKAVYESQSNAGPCFFCKKKDFLLIQYGEENWLDDTPYAFPEDQVMFFKMFRAGLKLLTSFNSGIVHLDASTTVNVPEEKTLKVIYSEYRNKLIFWHRFLYAPEKGTMRETLNFMAISYAYGIQFLKFRLQYMMGNKKCYTAFVQAIHDARLYLRSEAYKGLSPITKKR